MDTVKRSRTLTAVLTANGEVQTHKDAQVFVHDLNPFVTVHLLDETPAVLSLGKLCDDHGYSYEWVSGQKPGLTKDGKTVICKTDTFVPLVVPGLSTNLASSSSSSSLSQDSLRKRRNWHPGDWCHSQKFKTKIKRGATGRIRKIRWQILLTGLRISKKIWKKQNCMHPHHSSPASDLEYPSTVATKSRKHSIFTHFPKDRNCEVCVRTKMIRASCRRRTGEAPLRAEKFGDLITADHKVLNEGCESRDNHWYAVVVQDLATRWIQSYPCETKSSHETEKSLSKFLEPSHRPKVIFTDNSTEFGKACEVLSWNHRTSTPHRSETNCIAERAVRPVEEGSSAILLWSGVDERWWSDSMKYCCYLRNVQDSWQMGKWLRLTRFQHEINQEFINLARKYYQESFLAISWSRENLERRYSGLDTYPWRINAKEILIRQKDDENMFPFADGTAKLLGRDYEFRESSPRREPTVRCEDFSREFHNESGQSRPTENHRCRWSPCRFLVDSRWLKMTKTYSHLQMVQRNCQEETTNSENPVQGGNQP